MEYDVQIVQLTQAFYNVYSPQRCPEMLEKDDRPYNCLLVDTHYDYFICLPYRSNVAHKYAYKFRHSTRARRGSSGIDYTKMVIVKDPQYISSGYYTVDQDEYRETMHNISIIVNNAIDYLDGYIDYKKGASSISDQEFNRKYGRSTLPYFDSVLGLTAQAI